MSEARDRKAVTLWAEAQRAIDLWVEAMVHAPTVEAWTPVIGQRAAKSLVMSGLAGQYYEVEQNVKHILSEVIIGNTSGSPPRVVCLARSLIPAPEEVLRKAVKEAVPAHLHIGSSTSFLAGALRKGERSGEWIFVSHRTEVIVHVDDIERISLEKDGFVRLSIQTGAYCHE